MTEPVNPQRVQLRRFRGWRKPAGTVTVARPSRWGNPYHVRDFGRTEAIRRYRELLESAPEVLDEARAELAGRNLACWCKLTEPCHADILLELVNRQAQ